MEKEHPSIGKIHGLGELVICHQRQHRDSRRHRSADLGPFFFKDADGTVHLFVSISPINGSIYNPQPALRTHELHPLNADFTQWSAPVPVGLPSTNTNEFWVWKEGDTYHGIYVDFQSFGQYYHVVSTNLITGWQQPQSLGFASLEGGFILKKPREVIGFYLEPGNGGQPTGYRYYDGSDQFTNFELGGYVNTPTPMRNGKVIVAPETTSFEQWQTLKLSGQSVEMQGAIADPDRDGLPNLLEAATGLDPSFPEGTAIQTWFDPEGRLRLRHTRALSIAGVSLQWQESGLLGDWPPSGAAVEIRSITLMSDGRELLEWTGSAPGADSPNFFRLRASMPERPQSTSESTLDTSRAMDSFSVMSDDLFASVAAEQPAAVVAAAPLAERMRPQSLDEFTGQEHILGPGKLLRRAIEADRISSILLYGPPGTGKTTLAQIIARVTQCRFEQLSGVESNIADLRKVVAAAANRLRTSGQKTILFVDEIHRWNKAQQDVLLPDVERGTVRLIGATTENPFFYVNSALVSRSQVFQLEPLNPENLQSVLRRALEDSKRGLGKHLVEADEDAIAHLAVVADGDARKALNALEVGILTTPADASGVFILRKQSRRRASRRRQWFTMRGGISTTIRSVLLLRACAGRILTRRSIGWRRCCTRGRTFGLSRGGS
jgi:hypothetical protein